MAITRGTQFFFFGVEMFGVDRRNGRGHLYFGVDITLVKHHVNQQWVQTGWLVPSSAELTTIFPSITVLFAKKEIFQSGVLHLPQAQCKRTLLLGLIQIKSISYAGISHLDHA